MQPLATSQRSPLACGLLFLALAASDADAQDELYTESAPFLSLSGTGQNGPILAMENPSTGGSLFSYAPSEVPEAHPAQVLTVFLPEPDPAPGKKFPVVIYSTASVFQQGYGGQGLPIPRNCIAPGSEPLDVWHTGGTRPVERFGDPKDQPERVVRRWDHGYRQRAADCGVFQATRAVHLELVDPPVLTEEDLDLFGGKMPGTQNPPRVEDGLVDWLLAFARSGWRERAA